MKNHENWVKAQNVNSNPGSLVLPTVITILLIITKQKDHRYLFLCVCHSVFLFLSSTEPVFRSVSERSVSLL